MGIGLSLLKNDFKEKLCAVILCAGEGKRLKDITKSLPKPLIKIEKLNNISILNHIINNLINLEINQIAIVIGYLGEAIQEYISSLTKNNELLQKKLIIIDTEKQYKLGPLYSFLSIIKNSNFFINSNYYILFPGDTIFDIELLKEILLLISKNYNLIHNYPFIFYRDIELNALEKIYNRSKLISCAEFKKFAPDIFLRRISQIRIRDIISDDVIRQIVPIFTFNYKFIQEILELKDTIKVKTIWETFNYMIDNGRKIYAFRLRTNKEFYDIDTKDDLRNLKKKKDNRRSDYSK